MMVCVCVYDSCVCVYDVCVCVCVCVCVWVGAYTCASLGITSHTSLDDGVCVCVYDSCVCVYDVCVCVCVCVYVVCVCVCVWVGAYTCASLGITSHTSLDDGVCVCV